jgi:Domain of unknown function (DUF4476)
MKMKSFYSLALILIMTIGAGYSQNNNLVVYSQDGYRFSLVLNGILQNPTPSTNVKVTQLNATNYQAKIIFENKMPDLDGNVYLMWGGDATTNTEYSYSIVNVKGKLKLKLKSTEPTPIQVNSAPDPQQTTIIYTTVPPPAVNVETTTTTNTIQSTTAVPGASVGITFTVPGEMTMQTGANTTTTYSTTTTTTTTSGGMSDRDDRGGHYDRDDHGDRHDRDDRGEGHGHHDNAYVLPGYTGVYGCPVPMGEQDFEGAKQSIASKGFDDTRLTIAKQIIGNNCLLCSQIKELMLIMSFEASRLELAKFAWKHNLDRGNYYKLNDAFTFESSIDELNKYTQSH